MNPILTNTVVLALLVGISGCLFPFPNWREGRNEQGDRDQSARDCQHRDGNSYCHGNY
jgi:hypothetical protein